MTIAEDEYDDWLDSLQFVDGDGEIEAVEPEAMDEYDDPDGDLDEWEEEK